VILHLSGDSASKMPQTISKFTQLSVVQAFDGCRLSRGVVFVMPENVTMKVKDRVLRLYPRDQSRQNFSIDTFFSTVANDFGSVNLGVILSGMGSDGTQGALDLYRNGGYVFVQDPASTKYKDMPASAIQKDHPEVVGTPRDLGRAVTNMVNDIYTSGF
jgi:chemotaxis response regulator CheB